MSEPAIEIEHSDVVAWIWMCRPELHNAFDERLIEELSGAFVDLGKRSDVRVIVLSGRGRSFSAGADIEWMKRQGSASLEENLADAGKLANLFRIISESPKPTIARVQGAAIGGGVGLVAACDIAIGSSSALFAMAEVRLGVIPATIAPYLVRAIGERQARCLFQTGERINATRAERVGLLHEVSSAEQLDERVQAMIDALLLGGPLAQQAAKELVGAVSERPISAELIEDTARRIALCRAEPEAREGLSAFLEKRTPSWATRR
ncbi:MAG TPA: enoyl-CoA hydratase/isomerase family protein [Granulicella sp.]|jgi:methylglutaconyl-CoA hydratase|nr:enoyl-CoA hydratase/isomerase family protein [Granulicella sp.]